MKLYAAPLQGFTESPLEKSSSGSFWWDRCLLYPLCADGEESSVTRMYGRSLLKQYCVPADSPAIVSTPAELERLAGLFIEKGYKEADINMGCPFP